MYRRSTEHTKFTFAERLARFAILAGGTITSLLVIVGILLATGIIEVH